MQIRSRPFAPDDTKFFRAQDQNLPAQSIARAIAREESTTKSIQAAYEKAPSLFPAEMPDAVRKEILSWQVVSKSPYSDSFYDITNKSWDNDPGTLLRVADHRNFESAGRVHER